MQLSEILSEKQVLAHGSAASKKRAIEQISDLMASAVPEIDPGTIFDSLIARERLGGTGIGHGIALPHGRIPGNHKTVAAFLRLEEGIDYDALDQKPVDMLLGLLVPEDSTEEHLQLLASLAEMFSSEPFRQQLRDGANAAALCQLLSEWRA